MQGDTDTDSKYADSPLVCQNVPVELYTVECQINDPLWKPRMDLLSGPFGTLLELNLAFARFIYIYINASF